MTPNPHPSDFALSFEFEGLECLYRDHLGRRVVLDVEGPGELIILSAEVSVEIELDGLPVRVEPPLLRPHQSTAASGSIGAAVKPGSVVETIDRPVCSRDNLHYQHSALVACRDSGYVRAIARRGSPDSPHREVAFPYSGCGWVEQDHFWSPFFLGMEGKGEAPIAPGNIKATLIDSFSIADPAALKERNFKVQNMSDLFPLSSSFADGAELEGIVASHLNAAHWDCLVPAGSCGLLIRKLYDRFHGRQRARVLIDGQFVGWWYEPRQDRHSRWAWAHFGVPAEFLSTGPTRITIDPPAGAPLWSVSQIEIYSFSFLETNG